MKLVNKKSRITPLISKNKIKVAVNLFEKYVDEPLESIRIYSKTYYEFKTFRNKYSVDISNNKVSKVYDDLDD